MYKDYDLTPINFIPAVGSLEYLMRSMDAFNKGKITFLDASRVAINLTALAINNLAWLYAINNMEPFTR